MKRSFKAISAAVAAAMTISGMAAVPCYAGIKIPFIGEIGGSSVEDPELESMFGRSLKEMAGKFDCVSYRRQGFYYIRHLITSRPSSL